MEMSKIAPRGWHPEGEQIGSATKWAQSGAGWVGGVALGGAT